MKDEITRKLLESEKLSDISVMTLIRVMTVLQEILMEFDKSERTCEQCAQCHSHTD